MNLLKKSFVICCLIIIPLSCFAEKTNLSQNQPSKTIKILLRSPDISISPLGLQGVSSLFVSRQINCQLVRQKRRHLKLTIAKKFPGITHFKVNSF